jgi:hypothetical protein
MPEPTFMREAYSEAGRRAFDALLERQGVEIVDWWDALPDDAFHDYAHVTSKGRKLATALLADYLATRADDEGR